MTKNKTILFFIFSLFVIGIYAQGVPQGINYQGIAKNTVGVALSNQSIGIKIGLYSGSLTGTLEWEELHVDTTNAFGLFNIIIGGGISTGLGAKSLFSQINWGTLPHYLKVSLDITGGTNYIDVYSTQLLSVPYSLYSLKANSSENISINDLIDVDTAGLIVGQTLKWNGNMWVPSNDINNDTASYALNCLTSTNDWRLGGNSGVLATDFIGTINSADLIFKTNNIESMRITSAGRLGIGTATPSASVHIIGNEGFVHEGAFGSGTLPVTGVGTRMMWYPKKAAFRAGYVSATQWDDVNIGNYSFSTGNNSYAKGVGAVATGMGSYALDSCGVAMGFGCHADSKFAIAMGNNAFATAPYSVALGRGANANSIGAVGIGYHVIASGNYSTAFGYYTTANSANSVSLGYRSHTNNFPGTFIFSDQSTAGITYATAANQFFVKAAGGAIFYTDASLTTGVSLAPGSGSWATLSDKHKKNNISKVDGEEILSKISNIEIYSWNYKSQSEKIRHIGPFAQDFYNTFKLGESDTTISMVDIEGINLLALKTLAKRTEVLNEKLIEIENLNKQIDELKKQKINLESRLEDIEKHLSIKNDIKLSSIENTILKN